MWEDHWQALETFLRVRTQWRIAMNMNGGHYIGLEYPAVYGHPAFARLELDEQEELMDQLQHLEAGALEVMNS